VRGEQQVVWVCVAGGGGGGGGCMHECSIALHSLQPCWQAISTQTGGVAPVAGEGGTLCQGSLNFTHGLNQQPNHISTHQQPHLLSTRPLLHPPGVLQGVRDGQHRGGGISQGPATQGGAPREGAGLHVTAAVADTGLL
jgi:hypothetical protein